MRHSKSSISINKKDLKPLRERLPRHKYAAINSRLKKNNKKTYSKNTIQGVLNGNITNDDILLAAIDVAVEFQQIKVQQSSRFL
ncbi:MAG: hypothetical protein ACQERC_07880 [Bacteroidota bacterium]